MAQHSGRVGPVGFVPVPTPVAVPVAVDRGPLAPLPPPELVDAGRPNRPPPMPVRKDPAHAAQLVKIGDRLFRGNNLKKAEERYLQAAKLDAGSAEPQLR